MKKRYVSVSWAFYEFRQMLEYKANMSGQKVIVVAPKYTSWTCPKCGHITKAIRTRNYTHLSVKIANTKQMMTVLEP